MNSTIQSADRRRWLLLAAGGVLGTVAPLVAWTDDDEDEHPGNTVIAPVDTGLTGNLVVVGGGMAGTTAAKYLRLWGGANLNITLVEPSASYTSNIMSNLVLNGSRSIDSLSYGYSTMSSKYGITVKQASVTALNTANRLLTLSDGTSLAYDRLVLAPGIEFVDAYGLTQADYASSTPHAWHAGPQTTLLAQQIGAMANGDVFVMTIPKAPYRCPPGPYERACLVADTLKTSGRSNCRVVVLDENASIQAEVDNFTYAFNTLHGGVISYVPGVTDIQINPATKMVTYRDGVGNPQEVSAKVVNPIAPHRARGSGASGWLTNAGLANSTDGKWCVVDVLSYQSTADARVHVLGDAASCGLPKAGHVANQEAKICADAIVRQLGGQQPDPAPVANSACYSPITASTASWLTAVYQYDSTNRKMVVAANGGQTAGATAIEAASINSSNFQQMQTWFNTLMSDSFA